MNLVPICLFTTFLMVVLKLTGTSALSWWVVFSPTLFIAFGLFVAFIVAAIYFIADYTMARR